jgi:glycosyltransferase involved in cell wall biosynthesis
MKVLIAIPCLKTGGTEVQTLSLAKALLAARHQVTTTCYFEYDAQMVARYEEAECKVVCLSPDGSRPQGVVSTAWFLYKGFRRIVRNEHPDVAHVQYMAPGAIPIVILRLLGMKKIIATAHTAADIYPSLRLLHWITKHLLVAFTCITERAEQSFFGSSSLYSPATQLARKGNHFTIYNCLPDYINILSTDSQLSTLNSKLITIGAVGRLEHIKGTDLILTAFAKIHVKHPNTRLLIVGDGSLRKEMEAQLPTNTQFVGTQPQERLQDYYDRIDILLMPSRSEGFGLTALEGMARGCIVVAANVGGLPEVVLDGKTGFLHRREDIDDITEKVSSLLDNPQRMTEMSVAAVQRAKLFSKNHYNDQIKNLYNKLQPQ